MCSFIKKKRDDNFLKQSYVIQSLELVALYAIAKK